MSLRLHFESFWWNVETTSPTWLNSDNVLIFLSSKPVHLNESFNWGKLFRHAASGPASSPACGYDVRNMCSKKTNTKIIPVMLSCKKGSGFGSWSPPPATRYAQLYEEVDRLRGENDKILAKAHGIRTQLDQGRLFYNDELMSSLRVVRCRTTFL